MLLFKDVINILVINHKNHKLSVYKSVTQSRNLTDVHKLNGWTKKTQLEPHSNVTLTLRYITQPSDLFEWGQSIDVAGVPLQTKREPQGLKSEAISAVTFDLHSF